MKINISGISEIEHIKHLVNCIVAKIQPLKVYLFGSFAVGDNRESSDYDFYVVVSDKETARMHDLEKMIYDELDGVSNRSFDVVVNKYSTYEKAKFYGITLEHQVYKKGALLYAK